MTEGIKALSYTKQEISREQADVLIELLKKIPEYPAYYAPSIKETFIKEWKDAVEYCFRKVGLYPPRFLVDTSLTNFTEDLLKEGIKL